MTRSLGDRFGEDILEELAALLDSADIGDEIDLSGLEDEGLRCDLRRLLLFLGLHATDTTDMPAIRFGLAEGKTRTRTVLAAVLPLKTSNGDGDDSDTTRRREPQNVHAPPSSAPTVPAVTTVLSAILVLCARVCSSGHRRGAQVSSGDADWAPTPSSSAALPSNLP